jgi:hypothetical protein
MKYSAVSLILNHLLLTLTINYHFMVAIKKKVRPTLKTIKMGYVQSALCFEVARITFFYHFMWLSCFRSYIAHIHDNLLFFYRTEIFCVVGKTLPMHQGVPTLTMTYLSIVESRYLAKCVKGNL